MVETQRATDELRILELFADLLDYPRADVAQTARACQALVEAEDADAAALLGEFATFAERTPLDTLEEMYTATFELNATCHPYIGYHMFGEDYKRSALLLELKDRFREFGFDPGIELPDHVSVLLRFMAVCPDTELTTEIAREALVRTLEPMMLESEPEPVEEGEGVPEVFDLGDDYRRVLQALKLILSARYGMPAEILPIPIPEQERLVS
jgi:nitrate reductase delta subunit